MSAGHVTVGHLLLFVNPLYYSNSLSELHLVTDCLVGQRILNRDTGLRAYVLQFPEPVQSSGYSVSHCVGLYVLYDV